MAGRTVEVMAVAGGAFFGRDQLAAAADGRAYYYGSSGHGAVPHHHHHHHFVQSGAGGGGAYASAEGTVVAHAAGVVGVAAGGGIGVGVAPASFAAAGYGAAAHVVHPVAAAATAAGALQQPPAAADGEAAAPFKGAWTKEEDAILREMVGVHGDRKWATIARHLSGRIGKQCRERWINHLHPGIKKDVWTEEEDMALIEAHRSCGNRWSVIARHLPGRSENSVKNHWNATKRGLKAKRRLRKRNSDPQAVPPPVPGQLSLLAEYIRSLCPDAATAGNSEAPPPPPPPPPTPVTSSAPASDDYAQAAGSANPPPGQSTAGMYLGPAPAPMADLGPYGGGMPDGRFSYYLPHYAHMNLHYGPLQMAPPQQMVGGGAAQADFHAAPYAVVEGMNNYLEQHPFVGEQINLASNAGQEMEFDDRESSTNNQCTGYYGEAAAAGPSSGAGGNYPEEMEVVQMASREFAGRDQDDGLTLDLTRFR